jgi:hypothetical protein
VIAAGWSAELVHLDLCDVRRVSAAVAQWLSGARAAITIGQDLWYKRRVIYALHLGEVPVATGRALAYMTIDERGFVAPVVAASDEEALREIVARVDLGKGAIEPDASSVIGPVLRAAGELVSRQPWSWLRNGDTVDFEIATPDQPRRHGDRSGHTRAQRILHRARDQRAVARHGPRSSRGEQLRAHDRRAAGARRPDDTCTDLREVIVYSYRIICRYTGDDVILLTVHHGARLLRKDFD